MEHSAIAPVFASFAPPIETPSPLRAAITGAYRRSEPDCVSALIEAATVTPTQTAAIAQTTKKLVAQLRQKGQRGGVEGLVKEYALSSQEGIALMCLAEALLRIPDNATRAALIRDKIANGDWKAHLGDGRSVFVNAATWGLVVSGKLVSPVRTDSLSRSLSGLIKRAGEPVIRSGVKLAMEMMGEQFVTGETIDRALRRARKQEERGFTYSYDMLGEAAMTMDDAARYFTDYENAIHAIGKNGSGNSVYARPGISIKLSALHPRYERAQLDRVTTELLPKVRQLAIHAKHYNIGLNIDAEEADRLELSLDILETLARDPALVGWNGLGFVVQAYSKRAPFVLDWIINIAQHSGRRIMVRLVKGAYWDSEIKSTQVDGLVDFPVFTRKAHTDVSYIACARKLLAARANVFPQFATHNAQTLATIHHLAGDSFSIGDYEFQCLHGMGDALYEEVVGADKLNRPCRIYAPVGSHETLLAYLVRRLLENGANSSFVNRIWDENVSLEDLALDPVEETKNAGPVGAKHPLIANPENLFPGRKNSRGLDLSNQDTLSALTTTLRANTSQDWQAGPVIVDYEDHHFSQPVLNPADHSDVVGQVAHASLLDVPLAAKAAHIGFDDWAATPIADRAACLDHAASALDAQMEDVLGLIMREAGKSAPNAIAEVREAVDFLRYYANEARAKLGNTQPLGPIVCISPWNFPLAIFMGQIAAALVAGNTVLAKPAEETPLIAAYGVRLLHNSGVPLGALQLLPGGGDIGAALVEAPEACGVMFTGSTPVAKSIQRALAKRTLPSGAPIPFIAETGGQNAMVVDSSALPEQVVGDVIASAFDSAGQRCSALRILCVQSDIADTVMQMLKGALAELRIGRTDTIGVDIGPVISKKARESINTHIRAMRQQGCKIEQLPLSEETRLGTFVAPTIIEIDDLSMLSQEVFGPVLHVLRFDRSALAKVMDDIRATGYGLTFGVHSRIDETIADITARAKVGNIYINRNVIGAIIGAQPFGGCGLSGTGPKAGGPLYLGRLVSQIADTQFQFGQMRALPGPVGERNLYGVHPRGKILLLPCTSEGLEKQLDVVRKTGNTAVLFTADHSLANALSNDAQAGIEWIETSNCTGQYNHVLIEFSHKEMMHHLQEIAAQDGPIPIVQLGSSTHSYRADWMLEELSISIDTTAAGGNASLMAIA